MEQSLSEVFTDHKQAEVERDMHMSKQNKPISMKEDSVTEHRVVSVLAAPSSERSNSDSVPSGPSVPSKHPRHKTESSCPLAVLECFFSLKPNIPELYLPTI